jgi:cysteine desulfurase
MNIDLMSLSSLYGPKGIGALYIRRRPRVRLEARTTLRHLVSYALRRISRAPCELASKEMAIDDALIQFLSNKLCRGIEDRITMVTLNGHPERRYHGCVNYSLK